MVWPAAGYLAGACNGRSDHVGVLWKRGARTSREAPIAQLTDDLFPLPAKHTLEREEQEQEKWINLSNVKLPIVLG